MVLKAGKGGLPGLGSRLGVPAASSAALDSKRRPLARLADARDDLRSDVGAERLAEADRGGGLALS